MLHAVYLKLRFALSYRDIEELLNDRGISIDHATIQRWVVRFTPYLDRAFRKRKRPVGLSWRMDETYIKVKGQWTYFYRAVDKKGYTIDFFLSTRRNAAAAKKFLKKAIKTNGLPEKVNIDKSGANEAGIKRYNKQMGVDIEIRQCKYLNNIVEQDHRFIKKIVKPMLGFKSFESAEITLAGIELVRMLKKRQMKCAPKKQGRISRLFYSLAA